MRNAYQPDAATQIDIYRRMTLIKRNDERSRKVIRSGKLVMPYYSPRGQEVIPSAISVCLNDDDYLCTIYRGIHDMLAKGVPLKDLWAEIAGRSTGTCKGKGGPMHITHPASGAMLTTGVVGASMPIANGWPGPRSYQGRSRRPTASASPIRPATWSAAPDLNQESRLSTEILLPKLGFSMTEGVLAEWLVADGGQATEGEPLFALESDKSTSEVESPATGVLKILKQTGETYDVGTVLGVIE